MSEKRLIEWDGFYRFITSVERPTSYTSSETNQLRKMAGKYWDGLPKPALPDVTGTRTLDSMTEEEFVELMKIANLELDRIDKNPDDNSDSIFKNYSIIKAPDNELEGIYWEDGIDEMHERELGIEPGLVFIGCFPIHPRETFKWFIEKGFDVFGEGK